MILVKLKYIRQNMGSAYPGIKAFAIAMYIKSYL